MANKNRKLRFFLIPIFGLLVLAAISLFYRKNNRFEVPLLWELSTVNQADALFVLKKGDLLVRPNWPWLPGSFKIAAGRKYGHVAVVVEEAEARSIEEALRKAVVIEALFFDQGTRTFLFDREKQVRKTSASVSFGEKFAGIRYRLRMELTDEEANAICSLLQSQLDAGYNVLSLKGRKENNHVPVSSLNEYNRGSWNCATLAWQAYQIGAGVDIDCNGGLVIYPSDIIGCTPFSGPTGCIRF